MAQSARQTAKSGKKNSKARKSSRTRATAARSTIGKVADKPAKKARRRLKLNAKTADRHLLYEESVQNPEEDIKFLNKVFKKKHGRQPMVLREDFCGTAFLCAEWVKSHPERKAFGLDLDRTTLDWGMVNHIEPLGTKAKRVKLHCKNVMSVTKEKADVCVGFNFSYCIFQDRPSLKKYFEAARKSLAPGGAFVIDIHGGPESLEAIEEETEFDRFTYVWDQSPIDALSNHAFRAIHFRFPDGTEMKNAFKYNWRVWMLPELRDLLTEAGFASTDIYWEGFDKDSGEGTGIFKKVRKADNDESWIAYVVSWA